MSRFLAIVLILFSTFLSAQNFFSMKGQVVDEANGEPVAYAAILVKGTNTAATADEFGGFEIPAKSKTFTLIIYRIGYYTKEFKVDQAEEGPVIIKLKNKSVNLGEVTVLSKKVDTIMPQTKTIYTAFEFYDDYLVALANKGQSYNFIQVIDEAGTIVKERRAPKNVENLYKDCFGNVQMLSKDSSYQFFYDYEKIIYCRPYPAAEFYSKLLPCQCVFRDLVYFKETRFKNLINSYFYINGKDKTKKGLIGQVENKDAITAIKTDFDINYFLKARRSSMGGSYGTSVDEIKAHLEELQEKVALPGPYALTINPVLSELVKKDSCLMLLDYTNKNIFKYNFLGGLIKKDSITLKNIKPACLEDHEQKKLYLIKEEYGTSDLYEFSEYKGLLEPKQIKGFKFVKNLRCKNGMIYFIYRDPLTENKGFKIYKYRL